MTGQMVNPSTAALHLEDYFKSTNTKKRSQDPMKIVLIDELDALQTNKQTVLYNIFDWPGRPKSRIIILTIANTFDLPDRFKGNIQSRLGNNRISYQPYTAQQIVEILKSRI